MCVSHFCHRSSFLLQHSKSNAVSLELYPQHRRHAFCLLCFLAHGIMVHCPQPAFDCRRCWVRAACIDHCRRSQDPANGLRRSVSQGGSREIMLQDIVVAIFRAGAGGTSSNSHALSKKCQRGTECTTHRSTLMLPAVSCSSMDGLWRSSRWQTLRWHRCVSCYILGFQPLGKCATDHRHSVQ